MFFASNQYGALSFQTSYNSLSIPSKNRLKIVSTFLGVTEPTLKRWLSGQSNPPRAVSYALWHESPQGLETTSIHCQEGARLLRALCRSQDDTIEILRARISELTLENEALKLSTPTNVAMNEPFYRRY